MKGDAGLTATSGLTAEIEAMKASFGRSPNYTPRRPAPRSAPARARLPTARLTPRAPAAPPKDQEKYTEIDYGILKPNQRIIKEMYVLEICKSFTITLSDVG